MNDKDNSIAKPFLKWAGGKTQLLPEIKKRMPFQAHEKFSFIEPFIGSGAVLFWLLNNYKNLKQIIINDFNSDLINTYRQISTNVNELIDILKKWESDYHQLEGDEQKKKQYYYQKRDDFNTNGKDQVLRSTLAIFLNHTCFNGLYRVNKNNKFNVPVGSYKKPKICDKQNLLNVSKALSKATILNMDFEKTLNYATKNTFFYFDPPYRPLNITSSFNSYSHIDFNDNEQIRLKKFCDKLHKKGYKWLLSNSDPKAVDKDDNFFDDLYADYTIERVKASRNINSKGDKRGKLTELLIRNY